MTTGIRSEVIEDGLVGCLDLEAPGRVASPSFLDYWTG